MNDRREFLKSAAASAAALGLASVASARLQAEEETMTETPSKPARKPVVVATWKHGLAANAAAWEILGDGGRALDAVESGVRVTEADPSGHTVGLGGYPDRDGHVTLDACVMNETGQCGAVACLEHILHPVSVARLVMEKTPHVLLAGEGALQFALSQGFTRQNLLTPEAEQAWRAWLRDSEYRPVANIENHDTIAMLALDAHGALSGACTTSGMKFKMRGRVGDSPIIGAALYVDSTVGAACATGHGEEVIKTVGSFLVVELMRAGHAPQRACRLAIERITARNQDLADIQVGYLALGADGRMGACSIQPGFSYAVCDAQGNRLIAAESWA